MADGDETAAVEHNGEPREVPAPLPLIDAIREELGDRSVRRACDSGQCGACTVLVDGTAVKACTLLAGQVDGSSIVTARGLSETPTGRALQESFRAHHAVQCGYCTSGMLASATALLREEPDPDVADVETALRGNICRCTGYESILRAVRNAAPDGDERDE